MNGSFVEWFENNFTTRYNTFDAEQNEWFVKEINWYKLKAFLMVFFTFFVFILVLAGAAICFIFTERERPEKLWKNWI